MYACRKNERRCRRAVWRDRSALRASQGLAAPGTARSFFSSSLNLQRSRILFSFNAAEPFLFVALASPLIVRMMAYLFCLEIVCNIFLNTRRSAGPARTDPAQAPASATLPDSDDVARCHDCKGYINGYCPFEREGWVCSICGEPHSPRFGLQTAYVHVNHTPPVWSRQAQGGFSLSMPSCAARRLFVQPLIRRNAPSRIKTLSLPHTI